MAWVVSPESIQSTAADMMIEDLGLKHTLFLKKNIVVQGSYSSYMVLKSGTSERSTR